jgi:hypothetical protein
MRTWIWVVLVIGCGKSEKQTDEAKPAKKKWETAGYRDTTPEERKPAGAALAAAKLPLSDKWTEQPSRDGKRYFDSNNVSIELYLANASEMVAVLDEPPTTVDELVARVKPNDNQIDGWPFLFDRFTTVTSGSAGNDFWIRGPIQVNEHCGDHGCDPKTWVDGGRDGFVVYRLQGTHRFRCAAFGIAPVKHTVDEAFDACTKLSL